MERVGRYYEPADCLLILQPSLLKCLSFRNDQHQAFIELKKLEVIIINNLKVQQINQLDAFLNDAWTLLLENHNLREYKIQNH